jgi:DNA-directed RNA polymerase specialized sigma24 family protein
MRLVRSNPLGPATLDDLFVLKYEWLMQWALYFAQGDRPTAEDMVQDTFVQFAISDPELDDPQNVEALLYTYLKHVHLAHLRRLQKYPLQNLSIAEFDSINVGLRQSPSANPLDIQNNLRRILFYLCWRKDSAKSASILILRFFYGYFPEEITRIGLVSRPVVDNGLRAARKDLKRHLSDSGKVRVLCLDDIPEFVPSSMILPTEHFVDELREILLNSRRGACLPAEQLSARYSVEPPKPIECELLAHIVSCQRCLDVVTHSQKIPPLAERSFEGALVERHNPNPVSKEITFAKKEDTLKRSLGIVRNRIQEVLEHQPRSLTLVVNGHVVATQDVSLAVCKQEVEIKIGEQIELIEVLSEQGLCLLAMPVSSVPPNLPPEVYRQVRLSCGRTVEAWLRFTSMGPRVETSYLDPALLAVVEESTESDGKDAADKSSDHGTSIVAVGSREPQYRQPLWANLWAGLWTRLKQIPIPTMNPTFATALILAAASVFCFVMWWNQPPHLTANALLVRAEALDSAAQKSATPGVVLQQIRIKTSQRIVNHSIYRDAQGVRRPKKQALGLADEQLKDRLALAGVNWDEPLSAFSYQDWHDHQHIRKDAITKEGAHLLKLTTTVPDGPILQESLTVRDSDFHPVARTIELRATKQRDADTIEIAELSYDVLPWNAARENLFEPLSPFGAVSAPAAILPPLPHFPSEMELDEAALEARMVLHQLGADTSERIEIDRAASGVQVKGIVATAERKQEIEAHLHLLPHVLSAIYTFQELQDRQSAASQITSIKLASSSATPSPLEEYLTDRGMNRAQIGELGIDLSNASVTVSQESNAIEELLTQFGPNKPLTPAARAAFDQLLADHKTKILFFLKQEEQLLAQAGIPLASSTGNENSSQLVIAIGHHRTLCAELLSNNNSHPRGAQEIALELEKSLHRLRSIVANLSNPFAASELSSSPLPPNQYSK